MNSEEIIGTFKIIQYRWINVLTIQRTFSFRRQLKMYFVGGVAVTECVKAEVYLLKEISSD